MAALVEKNRGGVWALASAHGRDNMVPIFGLEGEQLQFVETTRTFFLQICFKLNELYYKRAAKGRIRQWSEAPCRNAGYKRLANNQPMQEMPKNRPLQVKMMSSLSSRRCWDETAISNITNKSQLIVKFAEEGSKGGRLIIWVPLLSNSPFADLGSILQCS
jgi:hypothetical protein